MKKCINNQNTLKVMSSFVVVCVDSAWLVASRNCLSSICDDNSLLWKGLTTTTAIWLDAGKYATKMARLSQMLKKIECQNI